MIDASVLADLASRVLEAVVSEGRKLGVSTIVLGQRRSASRSGGTDLRDVFPHFLLHRMRRTDARMLSGWPIDDLPDTSKLPPGECYVLEGEEVVRVAQPRMSEHDVALFAGALGSGGSPGGGVDADGETVARILRTSPPARGSRRSPT